MLFYNPVSSDATQSFFMTIVYQRSLDLHANTPGGHVLLRVSGYCDHILYSIVTIINMITSSPPSMVGCHHRLDQDYTVYLANLLFPLTCLFLSSGFLLRQRRLAKRFTDRASHVQTTWYAMSHQVASALAYATLIPQTETLNVC